MVRPHSQRDVTTSSKLGSEFARDSPLEEAGFELRVPFQKSGVPTRITASHGLGSWPAEVAPTPERDQRLAVSIFAIPTATGCAVFTALCGSRHKGLQPHRDTHPIAEDVVFLIHRR
jgi:hypothetical protein